MNNVTIDFEISARTRRFVRAAGISLVVVVLAACGGSGGGGNGGGGGDAPATCEEMCTHLRSEILDGCGKSDAATQEACIAECEEHQVEGEFDQNGLECAVKAGSCEAWKLCGDFL